MKRSHPSPRFRVASNGLVATRAFFDPAAIIRGPELYNRTLPKKGGEATAFVFLPTDVKGDPRSAHFCPASVKDSPTSQNLSPTSANRRMKAARSAQIAVRPSPIAEECSPTWVRVSERSGKTAMIVVERSPRSANASRTEARNRSFDAARREGRPRGRREERMDRKTGRREGGKGVRHRAAARFPPSCESLSESGLRVGFGD